MGFTFEDLRKTITKHIKTYKKKLESRPHSTINEIILDDIIIYRYGGMQNTIGEGALDNKILEEIVNLPEEIWCNLIEKWLLKNDWVQIIIYSNFPSSAEFKIGQKENVE